MARPSRRAVLKALGWSAAGITVAAGTARSFVPTLPPRNPATSADAAAWISLRPEGVYELLCSRVEMGQGILTGLRQIAAEELGVELDAVRIVRPDTALIPVCRATVGSDSMREVGPLVARAAAALAQAVLEAAALRLGRPVGGLSLVPGGVAHAGGVALRLAEVAAGRTVLVTEAAVAAARPGLGGPASQHRVVGRPHTTEDIRAIVTGSAPLYADDIRLPGMVFGARVRASALEAAILSVDDSACRSIPGYLGLYRDGGFHGIVATRRGALARALDALDVVESGGAPVSTAGLDRSLDVDAGAGEPEHRLAESGNAVDGPVDVDLRLSVPLAAHASIEPRTAVARFDPDGRLTVWTGTQDPFFVRDSLADAFGLAERDVVVRAMRIGGGFGARTVVGAELEAARLARLSGRPVKVQWSRRDEFRAGFHRPPSTHRLRIAATAAGRISRWQHSFRSGHVIFTSAAMGPGLQFATSFVADPGVGRGAVPPYAADALKVGFDDVRLPVRTGPWRGLGAAANHWAIETAVDAVARAKGVDPLRFRLAAMAPEHRRLRAVVEAVAAMAGWRGPDAGPGAALGLACGIYKEMAYAAAVARVTMQGGRLRVTRLWCAHDCGLVVNPDQVRAQVEGNLVWGIGMALQEELVVTDGRIAAESFFDYAIPRFSDVPEIDVRLVDSGEAPAGAGETAIVCGAGAITNAIAALTGETVTRLPVRVG